MIYSLHGLRALAMLAIFLYHSGLLPHGTFPVTFFFILSGFVLFYNHSSKINKDINLKDSFIWGFNKIKKMYPIHIFAFLLSIVVRWSWIINFSISELVLMGFINITLLQCLVPKYSLTFNNASWYLSTLFICYLFAVLLINILNKIKIEKYLLISIVCFELILAIILPTIISDYNYIFYISPYIRILDFFLGMILAKIFIKSDKNKERKYSLYELVILVFFIITYLSSFILPEQFTKGLIYLPVFLLGIYIISFEKGLFSKLLCNKILYRLADISFEFYMIHELILLIFFRKVFANLTYHWLINNIITAIPSFIISLFLARYLNKSISKKVKKRYNYLSTQSISN